MEDPQLIEHSRIRENLSMSSPNAMRSAADRFSFESVGKWLLFWLLLMAIVVGLAVLFRPETPAVIIYPAEAQWKYKVPVPDRWIPIGWGWYWRAKELVFGKRRAVSTLG